MPDIADDKLPLTTPDITAELLESLREVAPQVFCEGKIDFDKLKAALGATLEERAERYGLSWAGKSEAFRNVQIPSVATLLPQPAESVAWETTEHQIIEGDNLEVLKLLQKPYHGKIKMIYIDPPYNTGNEFIYPDNYREGLKDYLRYSGQVSEEGIKQTTNTETSGRFHSNWLSMIYPRLFLARNLLREDGVIFVSIDDNEVHNLRMLMNEVFGEENFVANIVWQKRTSPDARLNLGAAHDYIVCYARSKDADEVLQLLPLSDARKEDFKNPDGDTNGSWASVDLTGQVGHATPSQFYEIETPSGVKYGPPAGRCWAIAEATFKQLQNQGKIWFGKNGDSRPRLKRYLSEAHKTTAWTWWTNQDVGHNQEATKELNDLIGGSAVFDNPKPSRLINRITQLSTTSDDQNIVLDFFAGSGTTAQAVLELNKADGGNRKFILVQLPEKTDNSQFPTIAHITRERVRRVIAKLNKEETGKLDLAEKQDRGFRAFKLTSSNFKIWDADSAPTDTAALAEQLKLYADNVEDSRDQQDILFELILKTGLPLSSRIATIAVAGGTAYSIDEGKLLICLENPVSRDTLRAMTALKPTQMLCLDTAFHGDDALKTNTVLETRAHGVVFRTV